MQRSFQLQVPVSICEANHRFEDAGLRETARAKGVPEKTVFNRHILRNSLLPIAAFAGYSITGLLGGSIFIETVFSYPGMGLLFINSLTNRDYSVITALVLLFGILNLIGTLLSDIILSIVDPRVRIE